MPLSQRQLRCSLRWLQVVLYCAYTHHIGKRRSNDGRSETNGEIIDAGDSAAWNYHSIADQQCRCDEAEQRIEIAEFHASSSFLIGSLGVAGVRFSADANPRGRSPDEWDAQIAAQLQTMVTVHAQTTRIGLAVTRIVDGPTAPFVWRAVVWCEPLEYGQAKH